MEKILYILRGAPGSGKSTLAKTLGVVCESDQYFSLSGQYKYDKSKISNAHDWCRNKVKSLMSLKEPKIVVSNINAEEWEFRPYVNMAQEFGYQVFYLVVENRHNGINVHDCPNEKVSLFKKKIHSSLML